MCFDYIKAEYVHEGARPQECSVSNQIENDLELAEKGFIFKMPWSNVNNKDLTPFPFDKNKLNTPVIYAGQLLLVKQSVHSHHRRSNYNTI